MKTEITLCLMLMFGVLLCTGGLATATAVNSNSVVIDNIEFYVQTDKSVYNFGETVQMLYMVTNLSSQNVTYIFGQSPVWNFWVQKDGVQIWQGWWSGLPTVTGLTLAPGDTKEFPTLAENPPFKWNLKDSSGISVGAGNYTVLGGLYRPDHSYDYTKVSVPIEIIPEPTTFLLLTIGAVISKVTQHRYRNSAVC
jgi:hypothetical protein